MSSTPLWDEVVKKHVPIPKPVFNAQVTMAMMDSKQLSQFLNTYHEGQAELDEKNLKKKGL